ncbi:MAG: flippase-like domain-containing protein [Euryarchaeota archaeon]|nr:flippase-like domain-containing protein [Euryarchaeota archaeon]
MNKFTKWLAVSFLISVVAMVGVLLYTVDLSTVEAIHQIKHEYIVAAFVLHLLSFVVWGMRTRAMSRALGYDVFLSRAIEIVTSSAFLASLTPSSVGGEPLRIHLLSNDGMPLGSATAVVLGERVLDAILILVAAPVSLYLFRDVVASAWLETVLVLGEVFMVAILFLLLYGLWRPDRMRLVVLWVLGRIVPLFREERRARFSRLSDRIDAELEEFHDGIYMFVKEKRTGLLQGILYTILFWAIEFSMLPVILFGLDQHPSVLIMVAAQVLLMVVIVIPATPGSSGVAELGATTLFSVFVPTYLLGIVVVSWRAFTFYTNLLVGGFVSFKILKDTSLLDELLK